MLPSQAENKVRFNGEAHLPDKNPRESDLEKDVCRKSAMKNAYDLYRKVHPRSKIQWKIFCSGTKNL